MSKPSISDQYAGLKRLSKSNLADPAVTDELVSIAAACHRFLSERAKLITLESMVPDKEYVSYRIAKRTSRPINSDLYLFKTAEMNDHFRTFLTCPWPKIDSEAITKTIYTLAMTFCAMNDATTTGNKKTPATYFEILIGHLCARHLGVNARTSIEVLSGDLKGNLPTDLIFDLGSKRPKFHIPIKLSTRERVIQVWAHQRVVDGVYGVGRYKGLLVCLTETKLASKKLEVVEICLPDQWRIYQMYIAQLTRVYYLDVPKKYSNLNSGYPKIDVLPFGRFFSESSSL